MIPVTLIPSPKLCLKRKANGTLDLAFQQRPGLHLAGSKTVTVINVQVRNDRVIGETPAGAVNGSNALFTTAHDFVPESVEVFIETCRLGLLDDYNTSGNRTIMFYESPLTGEKIKVNYTKLH